MDIIDKIKNVDWASYKGPDYYDPDELLEALLHLYEYNESKAKNGLDNKVLFTIGNNHAGTYYPAIIEAADLLIEIEKSAKSEDARKCANGILNNLYYFEPELGGYIGHSCEELAIFVEKKLRVYRDET
jgi:hypothetical protein